LNVAEAALPVRPAARKGNQIDFWREVMAKLFRAKWLLVPSRSFYRRRLAGWQYLAQWETTTMLKSKTYSSGQRKSRGTVLSTNVVDNQHVEAVPCWLNSIRATMKSRSREPKPNWLRLRRVSWQLAPACLSHPVRRRTDNVIRSDAERAKGGVELASKNYWRRSRLNSARARVREAQANATKADRDLERMKQLIRER